MDTQVIKPASIALAPSKNRRYIAEVDHLRAIAALLVLFYHGLLLLSPDTDFTGLSRNVVLAVLAEGHSGVGLFIVLSGFILSLGAVGNSVAYKPFLLARILRIYPMLVVCLLVAISSGSTTDLIGILTTALPFNGAAVAGSIKGPFSAMFWAVAVEFQCYLVFPFLILFSNRLGSRFLLQVIAVALCLRLLATFAGANPRDISYWTVVGRIDQFCLGIVAARLYVGGGLAALRPLWFLPAAVVAIAMLWAFNEAGGLGVVAWWQTLWPDIEGAVWACFVVAYLAFGRALPGAVGLLASKFGEITYSFYLIHFAVISAVSRSPLVLHLGGRFYVDALATTFIVVLPITAAIALLTYHTIELPFLRLRPRYIAPETGVA